MVTNNTTTLRLRHDILYEMARAAWEGNLKEKHGEIPYTMIPEPRATYRCCICREREIIKQRVRPAGGKCPAGKDTSNVVQVTNAACEECPTASYIMTDSCHKCMRKACQNSCDFGAISTEREHAYIEPTKCKECGECLQVCPYSAVAHLGRPCKKICPVDAITYDKCGICMVDEEKCIQYGVYIHSCPFGAIGPKTLMVDVIRLVKAGKRVMTMMAPATGSQFGPDVTMASWRVALRQLGFTDMVGAGLCGDMTTAYETEEWAEAHEEGKKMTTSCCPAFVNMIKQHFPTLLENMSTTVSLMYAVSRMIKNQDPESITVLIGPCIAKKSGSLDLNVKGSTDYAMTFDEIRAVVRTKGVELRPAESDYQESSVFSKYFGNGGGVIAVVLQCLKEVDEGTDIKVNRCNGTAECKEALLLLKVGRLPEDFIGGIVCVGGCVGGPSRHKTEVEARKTRDQLIGSAEGRNVLENLKEYPMDVSSTHRHQTAVV